MQDTYIGPGYGEPSDGMIEATKLLAKKEAILLDPVYDFLLLFHLNTLHILGNQLNLIHLPV